MIVTETKMSEMGKVEEGNVGREAAVEAATAEIKPNYMQCLLIAVNTVPGTTISIATMNSP